MRVLNRSADRFQQALEGTSVSDEAITGLLTTTRHLSTLAATGPRPDPVFVTTLRQRLMTEAASLPSPTPAAARKAAARRADSRGGPVVVVVGHGLPRAIAGAVASALLICGIVGIASRGAMPGDTLYPVKGWLDNVAVRLAGSDLDRGLTYLQQAQEHISDARDLADQHDQGKAGDLNIALQAAIDSVRGGQRSLDAAYTSTGNPQALLAMADFTARALPQVDALRDEVPATALPALGELESLLRQSQQTAARRVAACGSPCSGLQTPGLGPIAPSATSSSSEPTGSPTSHGGLSVPSTALTNAPGGGGPAPGVSAGGGGLGVGATGGGAGVSTGGASVGGPTITARAPLPGATVTVPLPTATLSSGTLGATLPTSTLGPVTLPGATVKIP